MRKSCIMYDGKTLQFGVVSWFGSFSGILSLFAIIYAFEFIPGLEDNGWLKDHWIVGGAAAFGAQSVLVYSMPSAPASQPWNCMVGSIISAFIGVSIRKLFVAVQQMNCEETLENDGFDCKSNDIRPELLLLASALANSISILVMHLTDSIHPPAGAFTYIAVNAGGKISSLGYLYLLIPVGIGCAWFVFWSWFVNKYVNRMADMLFCDKNHEGIPIHSKLNATKSIENRDNLVQQTEIDKTKRLNFREIEDIFPNTEKAITTYSKSSHRKYPTGNCIGGWIRPLRRKQ